MTTTTEFKAFETPKFIEHHSCNVRSCYGAISTYNHKNTKCKVLSYKWEKQNRGGCLMAACYIKYNYANRLKRAEIIFFIDENGNYTIPRDDNAKVYC